MNIHPSKQKILDIWGRDPATMDELGHCIVAVLNKQLANDRFVSKRHQKPARLVRVAGLKWDLTYTDRVSNTHSAPLNGEQNWGCKDDKPSGYPGWHGRVWIRYQEPVDCFGSDPLATTLLHTGTGGWGSYDGPYAKICHAWWNYSKEGHSGKGPKLMYTEPQVYSWDARLYLDDWPAIADTVEKEQIVEILINSKPGQQRHIFEWTDPETAHSDQIFMDLLAEIEHGN